MVKVLVNYGWKWIFACEGCRSELEAMATDIKIAANSWYVVCPVCKTHNTVPSGEIDPALNKIVG